MLRTRLLAVVAVTAILSHQSHAQCTSEGWWSDEEIPDLPIALHQTCAAVVDGKIYIFGDYNHSSFNDSAYMYDPGVGNWVALPPIPTGRGQAACAAVDGVIYVIGGNNCFSNCWKTTVEGFDTVSGQWITGLTPLPGHPPGDGRGLLTATAVDGKIYVMGGGNSYVVPTFSFNHVYDPATDTWDTSVAQLPRPRSHHAAAAIDGEIYLFGGQARIQHNNDFDIPEVDVYNVASDEWRMETSLLTVRDLLSAVEMNGRLYVIGGDELDENAHIVEYTNVVEEYDPQTQCWRQVTRLPYAQSWGSAVALNRRIFVLGGVQDGTTPIGTTLSGYPLPRNGDWDGDGAVCVTDFLKLLTNWGPCE